MRHLVSMGELLVDFLPNEKGLKLDKVNSFFKMPGGAPANVASVFAKLGGKSYFMGQVGEDSFGHYLEQELNKFYVDTSYLSFNKEYNTSLVFVSLDSNGERDFMFYRNPSADQMYHKNQLNYSILENSIFHFCSVGLAPYPLKEATTKAIHYAKEHQAIISFDPNVRLSLWKDHELLKQTIFEFIPYANILKVSDDELLFLTHITSEEKAVRMLFIGDVELIIVTKGRLGVTLYTKKSMFYSPGFNIEVLDTTGAGDAFIGAFLYQVAQEGLIDANKYATYLQFSNAVGALATTKMGPTGSIPTQEEVNVFLTKANHVVF
jgi:fructokinase